jgi:uncharacterized sulfatase
MKPLFAFLIAAFLHTSLAAAQPNIVLVFIDDMGWGDFSCFGNKAAKTPHIDKLAAEGIKLTNFYVNSPICSASRVALTTGQYQGRWKIHSFLNSRAANANRGMADYLDSSAPTTAKKLKSAGAISNRSTSSSLSDSGNRLPGFGLSTFAVGSTESSPRSSAWRK